ncbi:MAG: NAD-dependent epimerase/dehydratase family protein [Pseudohongiellaceae bacterium]
MVTDQDSTAGPASTARHESNDANEGDNGSAPLAVVTGASGFIGSYLCPALKQAGYRVLAVTRPGSGVTTAGDGIDELRICPLQQASLAEAFAGAAVVFHLAGIAHTGVRNKALLREVNVQGTREVVRAAQAAKVGRLVYFSSVLAGRPGQSAYAESKQQAEELVLAASAAIVIGGAAPVNGGIGMRGNLLTMAKLIAAGRLPPLPRLENRLALVSVQDLCRAAILAAAGPLVAAAPLSARRSGSWQVTPS